MRQSYTLEVWKSSILDNLGLSGSRVFQKNRATGNFLQESLRKMANHHVQLLLLINGRQSCGETNISKFGNVIWGKLQMKPSSDYHLKVT